jgi:hypothetical protein
MGGWGDGPWSVSRVMPVMSVRKSTTYGRKQTSAVPISTTATVYPGMDGIGGITLSIGFTNSSSSTRHLHRAGAQLSEGPHISTQGNTRRST